MDIFIYIYTIQNIFVFNRQFGLRFSHVCEHNRKQHGKMTENNTHTHNTRKEDENEIKRVRES